MRAGDLWHEASALFRCYPPFVYKRRGGPEPGEIPVFVFHTIEPDEFEAQLDYLAEGGYTALSLTEFLDTVAGQRKPGSREVLLTFDDARTSFWTIAFPILKKRGVQATVFVITGWTPERAPRPTLADVWEGRRTRDELLALDPYDEEVCSWEELRIMQSSGLVTVDSHSHLHRHIFCSDRLTGVVPPDARYSASSAIFSPYLSVGDLSVVPTIEIYVGLPLFPTRAFLEDGPAVWVHPSALGAFRDSARERLSASGGRLSRSDIQKLQTQLPAAAIERVPGEALEEEIRADIIAARDCLREQLRDPAAGRTLCLPYTRGGSIVVRVAGELGLSGIFWGVSPLRTANRPGSDPMNLVRLKHDFIWRLPSPSRRSLASIYLAKAARRFSGRSPY